MSDNTDVDPQARESIYRPHPEERRPLAVRLEGWPLARPMPAAILRDGRPKGGLLRM